MKKLILYFLLLSGVLFIGGAYIYYQYQYKKFEEFFMGAKLYGSGKMIRDRTFDNTYKKLGYKTKDYRYSFFLENKTQKELSKDFHITKSFLNSKIIGGGSGNDFFNIPIFNINNKIYIYNIPKKSISDEKSCHYVVVEYEKNRQIRYYFEISEKVENKKYTIYFKSYPPKMILNAKNEYIKD